MKNKNAFIGLLGLALVAGCGGENPENTAAADGAQKYAEAEAAREAGNLPAALALYTEAAELSPTNLDARVQIALANLAMGDMAAADDAAAELLNLCPDSAEAWLIDGQVAYYKKDYERAMDSFGKVAFEKTLPKRLQSEGLVSRAVVQMAQSRWEDARVNLFRARRLDRSNPAAWYHIGVVSRDVFRVNEAAVEQFEMAARLLKGDRRAVKMHDELIPAMRNAIAAAAAARMGGRERDPAKAKKLAADAKELVRQKRTTLARKKYDEALAADPFLYEAAVEFAELLARSMKTKADVDKVLSLYRTAIEIKPYKQDLYLAAARIAYSNKRWIEATEILNRALAHDSENVKTLDLLIAAMQKTGRSAGPLQAYRKEL